VGEIERNSLAGPSSFARKVTCDVAGCEKPRIEAIAGIAPEQGEGVARQVRCDVCKGGYCTSYVHFTLYNIYGICMNSGDKKS
jgi:hypothetical protein